VVLRKEQTMTIIESRKFNLVGWSTMIAAALQTGALIRYVNRLPEDWIGITLCAITLAAFVAIAIGAFIQAHRKE
jgi:hypothetical protein